MPPPSSPARAIFQSTLPARGATRTEARQELDGAISIHAPRTGSDVPFVRAAPGLIYFNPRSPHGERRDGEAAAAEWRYFNPRSPHGERRGIRERAAAPTEISIHAPRTGSDRIFGDLQAFAMEFQSTLPARGATLSGRTSRQKEKFQSTLPARGATALRWTPCPATAYFNPRSPHGERRHTLSHADRRPYFNPRSPHGERRYSAAPSSKRTHFNPRSPHGERREAKCGLPQNG